MVLQVPPIQLGVPTTDKLHAWRLTNYSRVMFLDADVMAIAPLDDAFTHMREFTIAAHPYDTVFVLCCVRVTTLGFYVPYSAEAR